jgi:hypothetical protein
MFRPAVGLGEQSDDLQRSMENNLLERHSLSENAAMKTVLHWVCALPFIALTDGCATHSGTTAETRKADSVLEQPAEKNGPEIHASVTTIISTEIK